MSSRKKLVALQVWFGKAISHPLPQEYSGNPLVVSQPKLEATADTLLNSKGGLSGFSRLGIYNQQYWFRLVSIMQSEYPCTVHLLGLQGFNQWVIQFLEANPPKSPYLAELDLAFPDFMKGHYSDADKLPVLEAIAFDRAYSKAFDAPEGLTLKDAGRSDPAEIMTKKLCLAPSLTPLELHHDFIGYRELCRADESLEAVFKLKPLASQLVIHRDLNLEIQAIAVSKLALVVLKEFQAPALLPEVFERLEGKLSNREQIELAQALTGWFQTWVEDGWLCLAEVVA
jgi:hypothetical protein